MKLVAPDNEGVFTFTTSDIDREFIFVKCQAVKAEIEGAHCSNHVAWMNGCSDCLTASYAKTFDAQEIEKTSAKLLFKGGFLSTKEIQIANAGPKFQLIQQQLARAVAVFFGKEKGKAAAAAAKKARELTKLTRDQKVLIAYAAWQAIEWEMLIASVETDLLAAAQTGAEEGLAQFGVSDINVENSINAKLAEYAENRATEMVGKRLIGSELVDNSTAKFVIAETTKNDLEDEVIQSLDKNETIDEMRERIIAAATFGDLRSQLIAKNEVAMAQTTGHLIAWKVSGKVKKVGIRLSELHTVEDECDELASKVYNIADCPLIPSHPNCRCTIYSIGEE